MSERRRPGRLVRALWADGCVRALACVSTPVVEEARRRHGLSPTATAAVGRLLTAAALLAAPLKGREKVMLQVIGNGPLGHVVAEGEADGGVRGYAGNSHVHLPPRPSGKLDVAGAVGKGHLFVVRDLGLREPYRGSVPLVSGELAEDVAYYLARSEQTPSAVALGVLVNPDGSVRAAGGWMVAPMPQARPEVVAELERRARQAESPTTVLERLGPGAGPLSMLKDLLGSGLQVLERRAVRFRCRCSRRRFEEGLVALGSEELTQMAAERPSFELVCRFCGKVYRLRAERLRRLAAVAGRPRLNAAWAGRWTPR